MDIMNNMTVSTSKLTFSLIAISALLVSGSGFMIQDAYGANAPSFTATHLNTTATLITFDQNVNGTLNKLDWTIKSLGGETCAAPCTTNPHAIAGDNLSDFAISDILNGTASGVALHSDGTPLVNADSGYHGAQAHVGAPGQGFLNHTARGTQIPTTIVLIHAAIPSDATYFINFTGDAATAPELTSKQIRADSAPFTGAGGTATESSTVKFLKVGTNTTATDGMSPTVVSAEIIKSNNKQIRLLMSEPMNGSFNATADASTTQAFTVTRTHGTGNVAVAYDLSVAASYVYITLQSAANPGDVLNIAYTTADEAGLGINVIESWMTDNTDSDRYDDNLGASGGAIAQPGNRLQNFTSIAVTNWLEIGQYGDVTTCYDCTAPVVTDVQVSLDSSIPIKVTDDNQVHINAGIGDSVSVMVTVADNLGADTVPFAGIYTNFGDTPDNLFYANNFDSTKQMSTSYYEWNVRSDDIAFDNDGAITWTDATAKVNSDRTQTFTYTMTINDSVESSQVWMDVADNAGNYAKLALPITLEVSGAPGITFASDESQKVVSFFNESILLAIVSQWTAASSDDASNVEQLSSVLGIEDQLPTWTTNLASWVADDKIDVADMIVAVEYVINQ
jgi:hypothetical protein